MGKGELAVIWNDLWHVQIPLTEKVLRTALVYVGLAVLLRLAGKRDLAQLNSFDLVVMLLLSNVVQNAVIGSDNSLTGGLLGAVVLVAINAGMVRLANRYPPLLRLFEGSPTVLVKDGQAMPKALRRLGLRRGDVAAACHGQGADDISEIKEATVSPGGSIVVTLQDRYRDVTVTDLRVANAELLDQIRAEIRQQLDGGR
ncbi:MAG TPA: YetF domain-containing protein [Mycobacteriales bacterium]|nr:YetF domain-containing protein [Mycobacteriales bacterium]